MSVIIWNISNPEQLQSGECEYQLRINENVITYFDHFRPDGLAKCLRAAADAVDAKEGPWTKK